ncbi:major facilitator superfamily transporter [Acidocella aminolytica 101 = DSM 11237]|uniref:Major facilitator superfamily transporter n=4 Tax=Acidocella TaxID=50709 RepID=A0A0D6PEX2_9PROT|nr:major facilitator superfamily transporter [Acidocella aminolytica 101 = DSM 11237]
MASFAYQMAAVAVGWQIYALAHSAFLLGMVGLVQFLPSAGLVFFAGHVADRYPRKYVVTVCQLVESTTALVLALASFGHWASVPVIFSAVMVMSAARAFENPAMGALLPAVAPEGMLQKGTAMSSGVFQLATILGPALGGFIYALSPAWPYAAMAAGWAGAALCVCGIRLDRPAVAKAPPSLRALFAGVGYVRRNPMILGTISLDLFAVLLGGATALLPVYAKDVLHTGPWGLGVLRGAPAVGALLMTIWLARYPINSKVGMRMFQAVIIFGVGTVVFGLSDSILLSMLALAIMGASDTISVVIRLSLVQLQTPDEMRGRVGAVNFLFVSASNQLGEFESGLTAALFGAVPAVVLGGLGTIAVAMLWIKLFPTLKNVEKLE